MQKAGATLDAVKESIINAYELKTSLPRAKISRLMDLEQAMDVNMAMALGFVDGMIEGEKSTQEPSTEPPKQREKSGENKTTVQSCYARLNLLTGGKRYE